MFRLSFVGFVKCEVRLKKVKNVKLIIGMTLINNVLYALADWYWDERRPQFLFETKWYQGL